MLESASMKEIHDAYQVESSVVGCDGTDKNNGGKSGHPLVYLNMGDEGRVICPYCSRKFVLIERS
jgi:uncharacterized Zn-finger protein